MGISLEGLKASVKTELLKLPQIQGEAASSQGVVATRKLNEVLIKSEEISKEFNDLYISVEHLFLAIIELESRSNIGKIFKQYNINKTAF